MAAFLNFIGLLERITHLFLQDVGKWRYWEITDRFKVPSSQGTQNAETATEKCSTKNVVC